MRTAIQDPNKIKWDCKELGAYCVLNGLSMDDMIQVLRALKPDQRKMLSDNLDEHGAGFDRSRIHLALAMLQRPREIRLFGKEARMFTGQSEAGTFPRHRMERFTS